MSNSSLALPNFVKTASRRLRALAIRSHQDQRGVAAIEFALLLPVMLLMYFASAEVTKGVLAGRKITIATRALADLLGQQSGTVDYPTLQSILGAASPILSPLTTTNMKVTLSSVSFIQIGTSNTYNARTDWTMPTSGNPPRPCQVLNQTANDAAPTPNGVPVGLYGPGSVVVADVTYVYPTPFSIDIGSWKSPANITFKRSMFFAPRNTTTVAFKGNDPQVTLCTYPP